MTETMVRWIDGFYGGLIAGGMSAAFCAIVAANWQHDGSPIDFFSRIAESLRPFHGASGSPALAGLGFVLYLLLATAFGIAYTLAATKIRSMCRAPASVLWGAGYGLFVWWAINDVLVPVSGAVSLQPAWEGLVGAIVFYGIALSELTALARRRHAATAP